MKDLICRVCGFEHVESEVPWQLVQDVWYPSHEMCPCCDCQFGYDDDEFGGGIKEYRKKWLSEGGHFIEKRIMPQDWCREKQMNSIPKKWR